MKKLILILPFLFIVNLASAQRKAKGKKGSTIAVAAAPVNTNSTHYAVVASFISIGAGIDHQAAARLEKFVKGYPKNAAYDKIQRGREGETEYCFQLKEFSTAEQKTFTDELKKAVGSSDLVKFSENQDRVKK